MVGKKYRVAAAAFGLLALLFSMFTPLQSVQADDTDANTYHVAALPASVPPLLFTLHALAGDIPDNEPVLMWTERDQIDYSKAPSNWSGYNSLNALAGAVASISNEHPDAQFVLYVDDYYMANALEKLVPALGSAVAEDRVAYRFITDGGGVSYNTAVEAYPQSSDFESRSSSLRNMWQTAKDTWVNGGQLGATAKRNLYMSVYEAVASERDAQWWMIRKADDTIPTGMNATARGAILGDARVTSNYMNSLLDRVVAAGQGNKLKEMYSFDDTALQNVRNVGKTPMLVLGTSAALEAQDPVEKYIPLLKELYGDDYGLIYKPHPGNVKDNYAVDGIPVIDAGIAAEIIAFFNPDAVMAGYPSTTFQSLDAAHSAALLHLDKNEAYTSEDRLWTVVKQYAPNMNEFISPVSASDMPADYEQPSAGSQVLRIEDNDGDQVRYWDVANSKMLVKDGSQPAEDAAKPGNSSLASSDDLMCTSPLMAGKKVFTSDFEWDYSHDSNGELIYTFTLSDDALSYLAELDGNKQIVLSYGGQPVAVLDADNPSFQVFSSWRRDPSFAMWDGQGHGLLNHGASDNYRAKLSENGVTNPVVTSQDDNTDFDLALSAGGVDTGIVAVSLVIEVSGHRWDINISNECVKFEVNKVLTGRTLEANQFSFVLLDSNGAPLQTKTNAADGKVTFDAILYTQDDVGKTFTYTITEANGGKPGYTYDNHTVTAVVTVSANDEGTLETTVSYAGGTTFTNEYEATGEAQFGVTKALTGRALAAEQFSFELRDSEGALLQTKKNAANGKVTFDAIAYTQADAGKTFTYAISEKNAGAAGYTYDDHTVTVTVKVTDNGDGTLGTSVAYTGSKTFTNEYKASGKWVPTVSKSLSGRNLAAGEFSFQLKDSAGTVLQTKPNAADGTVSFDAIAYTQADAGKTYTYEVVEVGGDLAGVTYDNKVYTVTVAITDNGDGTLTVTPTMKLGDVIVDALSFINTYTANGSAQFEVTKSLTGRTLAGEQFEFELRDSAGALLQTKKNAANGKVTFDAIAYTQADAGKTFTYAISEKNDGKAGYAYDGHTVAVSVKVIDKGDSTLETQVTTVGETTFTNAYTSNGSAQFEVAKSLTGRTLAGEQFEFELRDSAGALLQTKKNAANGKVTFDAISYTQADVGQTFTYAISEKNTGAAGYTYDDHTVTVTVKVTDNGDGTLKTEVAYTGSTTFTNEYKATGEAKFEFTKALTGRALEAGQFFFELRDADTAVLQTATIDENGTVLFKPITYTQADAGKTFTYEVVEIGDAPAGYTYDRHTVTVTVTVTDNGDGTLKTDISYEGETTFTNDYKASGSWQPMATKTLEGRDLKAGEFSFELRDDEGTVVQTVTNDAEGKIAFEAIGYTEADAGKVFTYTISEKNDGKDGYTYDSHILTVTVTVIDNGDGTLDTEVTYDGEQVFENTYDSSKTKSDENDDEDKSGEDDKTPTNSPTPGPGGNKNISSSLSATGAVAGGGLAAAGFVTVAGILLRRRRNA